MSGLLRMMAGVIGSSSAGGSDGTPDAVNWANIGPGNEPQTNANQTITGIDTTISLETFYTSGLLHYSLNGGSFTFIGNGGSVDVVNNDTLRFRMDNVAPGTVTGTVTVRNASDGDVDLDTFTYNVTLPL